MYEYEAVLLRVVDGDTLVLDVDLGFSLHSRHHVRLKGVNAPEMRTDAGPLARNWVMQWFQDRPGPVLLVTSKGRETEKYGRYLGNVYAHGQHLNEDIVAAGHASPYPE